MPKLEMWSSSLTPFWMAGQPSAHDIPLGKEQCLWKTGDATHYPYFVDVAIRWSAFLVFSRDGYWHMTNCSQVTLVLRFNTEFTKFIKQSCVLSQAFKFSL